MASRSKGAWASGKRTRSAIAAVVILTVVLAGVGPASIRTAKGAPRASTPIDSCRTIDSPGAYALTGTIETERSSCIEITANDVVLDGNQYAITGNDSGVGISVAGSSSSPITNVTVTNVTATGWDRGISYENANGGTVSHAIAGGSRAGIALDNSARVRVLNSTATSNVYGFYLDGTTGSEVRGSTATLNRWGVAFEGGSTGNTIRRTTSTDNSQWDLHSQADSANNRVVDLDVGSGTFSLSETNLRARGTHTGENVFRSPPTAPQGWNGTGTYLEVDPVSDAPIGTVTATYSGQAGSPSSLSLWRYEGSWSRLQSSVNTSTKTVSARSVPNGTVALFAKPGQSIESRTLDRRSDTDRSNQSRSQPPQIVLTQGEQCYPLSALGDGTQPVEEFYGYRTPYTSPNNSKGWYQAYGRGANRLERANTSQLFLYDGPKGLSLVFLHDGRSNNDASGGTVTANIAGLPESGNWTVQDDHYHEQDDVWAVAPGRSRAHVEWVWNFGNRSDGGVFVGLGTGDWQRITVEMGFNEQSVRYPFEVWNGPPAANHVDRWIARSGTGQTYGLDMNRSVTLVRGSCSAAGTTQSTTTGTGTGTEAGTGTATPTGTATSASQQTTAPSSSSTSTTTGDSGSQASTAATQTGSDTPSEPAGLLSAITDASGQEFLGLGVLLVALVVLALAVFRR